LPCYQDIQCVPGPDASSVPGGACVPQWQAPCNVDSDCGDGFQCVASGGACDCSGSAANVPPEAGAVSVPCEQAMPPQPPCVNEAGCPSFPSVCDAGTSCLCWGGTKACQQTAMTSCTTTSDCLSGWTCMCPPETGGVAISPDASLSAECSTKSCEPPNWDLAFQGAYASGTLVCGGSGGGTPGFAGGASNGPVGNTPSSSTTSGSSTMAAAPGSGSGGGCEIGASRTNGAPWLSTFLFGIASAFGALRGRRHSARRPG
jgi:hypothetical protein